MKILFLFVIATNLVVQQTAINVKGDGEYTVIAPSVLYSEQDYDVAISLHHTKEPVDLEISIEGPTPIATQTIQSVNSNELKQLSFKIPKLDDGAYILKVKGVKGLLFSHMEELNFYGFNIRSFIQTDKLYYQPRETVHYRVIFLDKNLRPIQPDSRVIIKIEIGDTAVEEIKNFKVINGVYTGKLILSDDRKHRKYRISVLGDIAIISVGDLPASYIELDYDISSNGNIKMFIGAEIDVKPVNGRVTISFLNKDNVIDMVNGTAFLNVNLTKEQRDNVKEYTLVSVIAVDKKHNVSISGETYVHIELSPNHYIIKCARGFYCDHLHAKKEDMIGIKITHTNGTRITDSKSVVRALYREKRPKQITNETTELKTYTFESHVNQAGVALFNVLLPELSFDLDVEYDGQIKHFNRLYPDSVHSSIQKEPLKEWFKIIFKRNESFDLGELALFTINSSLPMTHINYYIIGQGSIIEAKTIQFESPKNIYNLIVKIGVLMMPHSHLYVYHIDNNGSYHLADNIFKVDFQLENELEILAPEIVKPGENITFKIITTPNSFVALTAVDDDVGQIINDIRLPELQSLYPKDYVGGDYNVRFLTNAIKHKYKKRTSPDDDYYDIYVDHDAVLNHMNSQMLPTNFLLQMGEQYDFEKTWIFENINNTKTEEFEWTATVPKNGEYWLIKAFAVHPVKGLALLEEIIQIDVDENYNVTGRIGMEPDVLIPADS